MRSRRSMVKSFSEPFTLGSEKMSLSLIGRGLLKSIKISRSPAGGRQNCMNPMMPGEERQPGGA